MGATRSMTLAALFACAAACGGNSPTATSSTVVLIALSGNAPVAGATASLIATATLNNGSTQDVTGQAAWASSNTSVATVAAGGVVTGVTAGEADITATYQSVSGRTHLTIGPLATRTFTLSGSVTDGTSGGPLPNIRVRATDAAGTVKEVLSAGNGTYAIDGLAPGSVTIVASAVSYQTTTKTITLSADSRVDFVLPRVACTFTVKPSALAFGASGGSASLAITSDNTGCAWAARSNDAFISLTGTPSGNDTGAFGVVVAANTGAARTGSITVAGLTVLVAQDAALAMVTAVYDPTLKAPLCDQPGKACDSGTLLTSSGTQELNQPNTIYSSCADGQGIGHYGRNDSIRVETLDGSALSPGAHVRITYGGGLSTAVNQYVYMASDALHPSWMRIGSSISAGTHTIDTTLPSVAGLVAIRVLGIFGSGPPTTNICVSGTDDDADDLVFRIQ